MKMIDDLPDECLEHVFSFLPVPDRLRIEKVCKRWYNISKLGWKNIKRVSLYGYDINATHVILKRCGHYIKKLDLTIEEESSNQIPIIIKLCKLDQVEEIHINFSYDCDSKVESIEDALTDLFRLSRNVEDVCIDFYSGCCYSDCLDVMPPEKLRSLKIKRENADDEIRGDECGIDVLRFPNLEVLDCESPMIMELEERNYDGVVFKYREIQLSYCSISRCFSEKFKFFTELENLSLFRNECYMDNEDIRLIAANCLKLKELSLDSVEGISSLCFRDIGQMPSLERFTVGLLKIRSALDIKHLTNVKDLSFYHCESMRSHDGLVQCILHSPNLQNLMLNKVLSLKDTFLKDVWEIYESGRRTVPLRMDLDIVPCFPSGRSRQWKIPKHPLLKLFINYSYDY